MTTPRKWTDQDLTNAVASAHSWRGVGRTLGLLSASSTRFLQAHSERLGLDTAHFRGQRTWADDDLRAAVQQETSWDGVARRLGLGMSGGATIRVKVRARELNLSADHFVSRRPLDGARTCFENTPDLRHLRTAAGNIAAAWFAIRGYPVSIPLEPRSYDLIVEADGALHRIQVKSSSRTGGNGGLYWQISQQVGHGVSDRTPYDPDEVDYFFLVSPKGACYLVPVAETSAAVHISESRIQACKVDQLAWNLTGM